MIDIAVRLVRGTPVALAGAVCLLLSSVVVLDVALGIIEPLGDLLRVVEPETSSPPPSTPAPTPDPGCTQMPGGLVICD